MWEVGEKQIVRESETEREEEREWREGGKEGKNGESFHCLEKKLDKSWCGRYSTPRGDRNESLWWMKKNTKH